MSGLSFGPAAFDIRQYQGATTPRRCAPAAFPLNRHLPAFGGNSNMSARTLHSCANGPKHGLDNSKNNESTKAQTMSGTTSQQGFSWVTIILMLAFGRSISLPFTIPSSVSTLGMALLPFAATIGAPTKREAGSTFLAIRPKQGAIIGASFTLFQLLSLHSRSISLWYMNLLTRAPLLTKVVTTATIGLLGDFTAQYLETRNERKESGTTTGSWFQNYDRRRAMSVFGENILISGPLLHFAYNFMEHILPTSFGGSSAMLAALGHALIDNFVLDTIFLAIMFVTTGIAEGYVKEIKSQFQKDFVPTLMTGWLTGLCLMPIQFCLFRFLPLSLRVLGVNIIDVFWEAYISYMVHRRRRMAGEK